MNLANNWNEISLYQYLEIEKAKNANFDSSSELHIELLSILLNTTPDDEIFDDISWDEITDSINNRQWLFVEPNQTFIRQIDEYTLTEFNKLTLGQFIDIEYYIENEEPFKILPIIFKRTKTDEWDNLIFEPYLYDVNERYELFLDTSVTKLYGVLMEYYNWREEFLRSYENLFQDNPNVEDESELTGREKIDAEKEAMEEKAKSKWSWESILLGLSNGDVTKFDDLFNTSLILVFNTLSAKKTLGV